MKSGSVCRAILSAAGDRLGARWLADEALDGVGLGLVSLEHRQQLGDGEQILNPLGQVQELQLAPLPADRRVGADDLTQPRAVDVRHALEVEQQLLTILLNERIDLVLQK